MNSQIINMILQKATSATEQVGVPKEKIKDVADTTAASMVEGFKENLNLGNLSSILEVFNNGTEKQINSNPLVSAIQNTVKNSLISQMNLSHEMSGSISQIATQAVMKVFTKGSDDSKGGKFDFSDLIKSFASQDGKGDSILGNVLGGLFK